PDAQLANDPAEVVDVRDQALARVGDQAEVDAATVRPLHETARSPARRIQVLARDEPCAGDGFGMAVPIALGNGHLDLGLVGLPDDAPVGDARLPFVAHDLPEIVDAPRHGAVAVAIGQGAPTAPPIDAGVRPRAPAGDDAEVVDPLQLIPLAQVDDPV